MSLIVYNSRECVPEKLRIVDNNGAFFDMHTMIPDTDLAKEILKTVDKAGYYSEQAFTSRTKEMGNLYRTCLSTGTKTLLNIITHPDICFNVTECGINAVDFFRYITNGIVLWPVINMFPEDDYEGCDIVYQDKHFTNIYEFLNFVRA